MRYIRDKQKFMEFGGISWYNVLWDGCEMDEYQNIEFVQGKVTVETQNES